MMLVSFFQVWELAVKIDETVAHVVHASWSYSTRVTGTSK